MKTRSFLSQKLGQLDQGSDRGFALAHEPFILLRRLVIHPALKLGQSFQSGFVLEDVFKGSTQDLNPVRGNALGNYELAPEINRYVDPLFPESRYIR